MCGVIGVLFQDPNVVIGQSLVDVLTILQHRGQDAAGIVTSHHGHLNMLKNVGPVSEVFTQNNIHTLEGNVGIGHVRYPTAGGSCSSEAQPLYTNAPYGLALAHNGNLTNPDELRDIMRQTHRHINTNSDSELLLNVFAEELQRKRLALKLAPDEIFATVRALMKRCKGAYGCVVLINGVGLLGFRDPHGIRPLCFGYQKDANGGKDAFAIASESVGIDAISQNFVLDRDIAPGESVFIDMEGNIHSDQCVSTDKHTPCIFEYIYFARPDSIMDVYQSRLNMGEKLAKKILREFSDHDIDVVIPIPDTSRTSALQCAYTLGKPYTEGFIKNRYIGRTFIMPGQALRQKKIRLKLNPIEREFTGRSVLLVDDSIVRGSTSLELVQMARDAGAKRVYFASAAPPIKHPNVYGIDIPTSAELVAFERSVEDVALAIGADKVLYNDLEDVIDAVRSLNQSLTGFDTSCFNGKYVTPEVTEEYLRNLLNGRGLGRTGAKKSATAVAMACNSYNDNDRIDDEHTVKKARVNNENDKSGSFKPSLPPAVPLLRSISDDKASCLAK